MSLEKAHPTFQAKIRALAAIITSTNAEGIYQLWREYSDKCSSFDQSPVMSEFIEWNADRLGVDRAKLHAAVADL